MAALNLHRKEGHKQRTKSLVRALVNTLVIQALVFESGVTLNCSEPTTKSLLDAFTDSIFNVTAIRPVNHLKTPTNVNIAFTLYRILGVDEKSQLLQTLIWFTMTWKIEFLSWDPEECGTSTIALPREKFWVPDIIIDEFVDENNAPDTFYMFVSNNGEVFDSMAMEVVSSCNLDIYKFPFDVQNCTYTFNSWIHNADEIQLSFGRQVEEIFNRSKSIMDMMGEWELIDMTANKHDLNCFDGSTRQQLKYHIILKRRPIMYVVNLLIPSLFLIAVDLFSFLLPPQNVDRSAFKMTLILGYTVFLLLMNDLLPVTGNTIPLINVFFSLSLALMVGSLLETILITNMLCGSICDLTFPNWMRVIFLNYLARLVCMAKRRSHDTPQTQVISTVSCAEFPSGSSEGESQRGTIEATESQTTDPRLLQLRELREELQAIQRHLERPETTNETAEDWIYAGLVIDRFLFWAYIFFLLFSFIAILVIWITWYTDYNHEDH